MPEVAYCNERNSETYCYHNTHVRRHEYSYLACNPEQPSNATKPEKPTAVKWAVPTDEDKNASYMHFLKCTCHGKTGHEFHLLGAHHCLASAFLYMLGKFSHCCVNGSSKNNSFYPNEF